MWNRVYFRFTTPDIHRQFPADSHPLHLINLQIATINPAAIPSIPGSSPKNSVPLSEILDCIFDIVDPLPRYTLRVPQELLDKLAYIANYEGRTKNKELEQLIKKHIDEFEAKHGTIPTEESQ